MAERSIRWGMTVPFPGITLDEHHDLISLIGNLGYDDIWSSEANGADAFTILGAASVLAPRVRLATGIVNTFTRPVGVLAQTSVAMAELSKGNFCLGLGSSTKVMVESWHGISWEKPLAKMRKTILELRELWSGGRLDGGFKLERLPKAPIPIAIGCLGSKMIALAGEVADIALITSTPVSAIGKIREAIQDAQSQAGRSAGSVELAARIWCIPGPEKEALEQARGWLSQLLGAPPYIEFYASHGWGDLLKPAQDAWAARDKALAAELIPESFLREIVVFGEPEEMKTQLRAFAVAGVDTLILAPLCGAEELRELLIALSPSEHQN